MSPASKPRGIVLLSLALLITGAACAPASNAGASPDDAAAVKSTSAETALDPTPSKEPTLTYPVARRGDQVDDYHGAEVADPYRWLEDPDSDESRVWIEAENAVTDAFLADIPEREALRARLRELWNYERFGIPQRRGERYFYERNDGLQDQSVLYWAPSLDAEPRLLLDPNTLSEDNTVSLAGRAVSDDGALLAYGLSVSGSDWRQWKVRDVETGEDLDDQLDWVKFSGVSWTPDGAGFYYSRYDEPNEETKLVDANYFQKLYYHRLGEPQSADKLVYHRPDEKEWGFGGDVTEDGRFLIITVWRGTERKNQVFYQPLGEPDAPVVELIAGFEAHYDFLGNDGSLFWFRTDLDAPRYRVISVDVESPARDAWREVIPQQDDVLESVSLVGDRFIASYLHHAHTQVELHDLTGAPRGELALPGLGTAGGFGGRRQDEETFYAFTSFTRPATIYRYDLAADESTVFRAPELAFDPEDYVTEQVFYTSRDGTRVPMFITRKASLEPSPDAPVLLYGYGGFNISLTPSFSVSNLVWLERGGVYATPNLRGGGEYGRPWHEAGMLDQKQNVFDDFQAAAEWLIDNGYTSREKLAISGRSNGGLLVGACMTQRPELFAAALPGVGVLDMLRFHKFTIGWAWVSEFGSSDDAAQFPALRAYSPLHNLQAGVRYPATLIFTADHDDRVVPGHSFKFAAALQAAHAGPEPVLIRIETRAGHGAGTPVTKRIDEAADALAFLVEVLDLPPANKGE